MKLWRKTAALLSVYYAYMLAYRAELVLWALANWLLDAASLWVFIRAFGYSLDLDALIVTFGLANLVAAIPITPGGIGYVDLLMVSTLVGFGDGRGLRSIGKGFVARIHPQTRDIIDVIGC